MSTYPGKIINSYSYHIPSSTSSPSSYSYSYSSSSPSSSSLGANPRKLDIGDLNTSPKELMNHDLLSADDELTLARHFKIAAHITQQRLIHPSDEEISALLEIPIYQVGPLVNRGDQAKKILVQSNMRLVLHIAKYYRYRGVAYPDLVEEGTFGLMKAVDKFDPDKGFRFSTYASWWIKQSVSRAIAEKSRIVRLPVHIHDMMVSVARAEKEFTTRFARKPTPAELAERLALPLQKVELLLKSARNVNSIDENAFNSQGKSTVTDKEIQVKDRLVSEIREPSTLSNKNSLRSEIRRFMGILSEREAEIVEMRFGLADGNQMTLEEIGKKFNVTRERIRQIEARALSKMRHPAQSEEFKEIFQTQLVDNNSVNQDVQSYADA